MVVSGGRVRVQHGPRVVAEHVEHEGATLGSPTGRTWSVSAAARVRPRPRRSRPKPELRRPLDEYAAVARGCLGVAFKRAGSPAGEHGSVAAEPSRQLDIEISEVDAADAVEALGGPRLGQGVGQVVEPGLGTRTLGPRPRGSTGWPGPGLLGGAAPAFGFGNQR